MFQGYYYLLVGDSRSTSRIWDALMVARHQCFRVSLAEACRVSISIRVGAWRKRVHRSRPSVSQDAGVEFIRHIVDYL